MASLSGVSSNNTVSSLMNSANMISGLASGLDTESMIENLVKSYQTKIDTLNQKVTKTEWKQDSYRSIISKMVGFSSKYTSYTSGTNLTSPSFFNNAVNVETQGKFADKVAASGKSSSDIALNAVHQLATSAQYRTSSNLKSGDGQSIVSESGVDLVNGTTELSKLNGSLTLTYGSKTVSVQFDEVADVKALEEIQTKAKEAGKTLGNDEALAKLIEQKLAGQKITLNGGSTAAANERIKVEAKDGTISFGDKSTAGNSVYISGASGQVAAVFGLDLDNASKDKINSVQMSAGMRDRLTRDVNNAEYLSGKTMNLSLDGTTKQIELPSIVDGKLVDADGNPLKDADGKDISELNAANYTAALNEAVQKAYKGNKIKVENADATGNTLQLSFKVQEGSDLVINTDVGETLGIGRTATSYLNTSKTLEDLLGDKLKNLEVAYERDEKGRYKLDKDGQKIAMKDDKGDPMYDFKINGVVVGSYSKNSKLSDVLSGINGSSEAGVRVSYSQTTKNFLFSAKETGLESEIQLGEGLAQTMFGSGVDMKETSVRDVLGKDATAAGQALSLTVDGSAYTYNVSGVNPSMKNILDALNGAKDADGKTLNQKGLKAEFGTDGSLVIRDKDGKQVETTDHSEFLTKLTDGLKEYTARNPNEIGYTKGQDAKFTITVNGEQKEMNRSSNNVDIDGLTITFKEKFDSSVNEDGTQNMVDGAPVYKAADAVTFKTTTDSDKIVDAVKTMIDDYNTMMSEIKSAYSTMPYQKSNGSFANYEPLTDDDRAGMSEAAIERYEEKAKQGILFGDRNLSSLYDKMRNVFAGTNEAALRSMGITIGYSISDGVQTVTLDEGKLRDALESDPERVTEVFTGETGVMQTMKTQLDNYAKTTGEPKGILIQQAGSPLSSLSLMSNTWQKEIDNINTQIEKWQDKLTSQVERYTSQFSRLEVLINQMNSQSSTLAGLMGG